jgi:hypothetical protein
LAGYTKLELHGDYLGLYLKIASFYRKKNSNQYRARDDHTMAGAVFTWTRGGPRASWHRWSKSCKYVAPNSFRTTLLSDDNVDEMIERLSTQR